MFLTFFELSMFNCILMETEHSYLFYYLLAMKFTVLAVKDNLKIHLDGQKNRKKIKSVHKFSFTFLTNFNTIL